MSNNGPGAINGVSNLINALLKMSNNGQDTGATADVSSLIGALMKMSNNGQDTGATADVSNLIGALMKMSNNGQDTGATADVSSLIGALMKMSNNDQGTVGVTEVSNAAAPFDPTTALIFKDVNAAANIFQGREMTMSNNGQGTGGVNEFSNLIDAFNPYTRAIDKGIDAVVKIFHGRQTDPEVLRMLEEQYRVSNENGKRQVELQEIARKEHRAHMEKTNKKTEDNLRQMRTDEKESINQKEKQMYMDNKEENMNLKSESAEKRKADEKYLKKDSKAMKALGEQQNASNEFYKKEMEHREAARKEQNALMEKAQKAAEAKLRQIRLDEKESIGKKQEQMYTDYKEAMKNLKSESAEKRKADEEFQKKDSKAIQVLKTLQTAKDAVHQQEVERREAEQKAQEAFMEKAHKAADENLRQLKLEEKESIRKIQSQIDADQVEFERKMEKKNQDHCEEMKILKSKSLEEWRAEDAKHQEETRMLRATHDEDKRIANQQLEEVRKLGLKKIEDAEKAIQKMEKERFEKNELFYKEMIEMEKKYQEESRNMSDKEFKLKLDSIEQKREQASIENKQKMDHLDQLFHRLEIQNTTNSTKDLLKQFQSIVQTTENVLGRLKNLSISCEIDKPEDFVKDLEDGLKADIEDDVETADKEVELFKTRVQRFELFKLNSSNVHPEALNLCNDYLKYLKKPMESTELKRICSRLVPAVDRGNIARIESFREDAKELELELEAVRNSLTLSLNGFQEKCLPAARAQAALKN